MLPLVIPATVRLPLRCTRIAHLVLLVLVLYPVGVFVPTGLPHLLSSASQLCLAFILLARSALPS
jgi:hypothetical protein